MTMRHRFAALFLAAILSGCASIPSLTPPERCPPGLHAAVNDLLYFGTTKPGGAVSLKEWSDFLWDDVTPKFPDGFTAWQAYGQWRPDKGEVQRELSYVVSIVHPEGDGAEAGIQAVIADYKSRFHQESVLRVSSPACVSF